MVICDFCNESLKFNEISNSNYSCSSDNNENIKWIMCSNCCLNHGRFLIEKMYSNDKNKEIGK